MTARLTLVDARGRAGAADFEAFYREQVTAAVRLAFLLCGDRSVAEDVAAEALTRVYRRWGRTRLADPGAYLRRAVVNEVRSRGRRKILERRERDRRVVDATESGPGERSATRHVLVTALAELPMHQRSAIVLRYFEDLSVADTASVLGKDVGTVKSSVSRGLARRRELLGEDWSS